MARTISLKSGWLRDDIVRAASSVQKWNETKMPSSASRTDNNQKSESDKLQQSVEKGRKR